MWRVLTFDNAWNCCSKGILKSASLRCKNSKETPLAGRVLLSRRTLKLQGALLKSLAQTPNPLVVCSSKCCSRVHLINSTLTSLQHNNPFDLTSLPCLPSCMFPNQTLPMNELYSSYEADSDVQPVKNWHKAYGIGWQRLFSPHMQDLEIDISCCTVMTRNTEDKALQAQTNAGSSFWTFPVSVTFGTTSILQPALSCVLARCAD